MSGYPLRAGVAEEIRAMMGRRQVTGAWLAKQISRSEMYVSRRLRGETSFDLDDLERIAEALDVSVIELLPRSVTEPVAHVPAGSQLRVRSSQVLDAPSRPAEGHRPGQPQPAGKRGPGRRPKRRLSIA